MKAFILSAGLLLAVGISMTNAEIDCYSTSDSGTLASDAPTTKGDWCRKVYYERGNEKVTVSRSAVSKEWVDEANKEGAGYELGCDSSSIWDTSSTDCFCDEDKCNGAGANLGSIVAALVLAVAAIFVTKM